MKTLHALGLTALLAITLTACSAGATESTPTASPSSVPPSASATPRAAEPITEVQAAPATFEEAVKAGYGPYTDNPLAVMRDIRTFALDEVKPLVPVEKWNEADIIQIRASLDILSGKITDRELELETIKYTTMIHNLAVGAGVLSY
ncbi:hypothetical protein ACX80N_12450 [Arthrobacter sp. MDT2-16]